MTHERASDWFLNYCHSNETYVFVNHSATDRQQKTWGKNTIQKSSDIILCIIPRAREVENRTKLLGCDSSHVMVTPLYDEVLFNA
jgi:hypothetical protein